MSPMQRYEAAIESCHGWLTPSGWRRLALALDEQREVLAFAGWHEAAQECAARAADAHRRADRIESRTR